MSTRRCTKCTSFWWFVGRFFLLLTANQRVHTNIFCLLVRCRRKLYFVGVIDTLVLIFTMRKLESNEAQEFVFHWKKKKKSTLIQTQAHAGYDA